MVSYLRVEVLVQVQRDLVLWGKVVGGKGQILGTVAFPCWILACATIFGWDVGTQASNTMMNSAMLV